jgi:hypothetical protein
MLEWMKNLFRKPNRTPGIEHTPESTYSPVLLVNKAQECKSGGYFQKVILDMPESSAPTVVMYLDVRYEYLCTLQSPMREFVTYYYANYVTGKRFHLTLAKDNHTTVNI